MKPIFRVTVFLCLLVAAKVDAAALGEACDPADDSQADCTDANAICPSTGTAECQCKSGYTEYGGVCAITHGTAGGACLTSGSACTGNTLVCESNVCKIKAGAACAAPTSPCVSQSTCSTTCNCNDGYSTASTGLCIITPGTAGGACLTSTPACSSDTLVCESSVCKIKAGAACTTPTSPCVPQSTCSTTCNCNDGYSTTSTGLCNTITEGKVNAACDVTKPCTGTNVVCDDGFCTCNDGFSGNKGDDDCISNKGVALGQVSLWTLCITILMSLAVNVV